MGELASHNHSYYFDKNGNVDWHIGLSAGSVESDRSTITNGIQGRSYTLNIRHTGDNQRHNTCMPYLSCYCYIRLK